MKAANLLGLARAAFILLIVGVVWELAVVLFAIKPQYLPRLSAVAQALAATPGAYAESFFRTLLEALIGFGAGALFGVVMAVVFFRNPTLKDVVFPLFIISQTIPVIAFGALVVLWFGNTLYAKAIIAFYVTFFPVTVNSLMGLQSVDARQVALLRSFGARPFQLLYKLQLPSALPQTFVALRLGASLSLVGAIVGEWFGDTVGLGVLLLQAMYNETPANLWAALILCACMGYSLYAAVLYIESKVVFWKAEQQ